MAGDSARRPRVEPVRRGPPRLTGWNARPRIGGARPVAARRRRRGWPAGCRGPGRSGRCGPARGSRRAGPASMNASIFFSWPEISIMICSGPTSTIRPGRSATRPWISARRVGGGVDLDQHQVALDEVLAGDVEDLDDRDDLLELLADLLQDPVVAHDHEGDPREVRVLGLADGQAVDVEPARGEHARDVGQHARLVLHQGREDMADPARSSSRGHPRA